MCGAEALIRWRHPSLGLLYPDRFIAEAERSGLIEPITVWVLDEALRQCRAWLDVSTELGTEPLSVAVNLSTRCLFDAALPGTVAEALERWQVPGRLLELEITETVIMADPKRARGVLGELAGMGVVLAIDDFGTGYSSLAYLRELPVAELKIDRSFVIDMERTATTPSSSGRSSTSPATWASAPWPRGWRTSRRGPRWPSSAVTRPRVTCWPDR